MDILLSEREKRICGLGVRLIQKKLGKKANPDNIHNFLSNHESKAIRELHKKLHETTDKINCNWQKYHLEVFGELGVYILINFDDYKGLIVKAINKFTEYKITKEELGESKLTYMDRKILKLAMRYIAKKLLEKPTFIEIMTERDLTNNKLAGYLNIEIDKIITCIPNRDDMEFIRGMLWLGLWFCIHDTAYRDEFYYYIYNVGNKNIKELANKFYVKPEMWYINVYTEGVNETREKWRSGLAPRHYNSVIEEVCVPYKQRKNLRKYMKR